LKTAGCLFSTSNKQCLLTCWSKMIKETEFKDIVQHLQTIYLSFKKKLYIISSAGSSKSGINEIYTIDSNPSSTLCSACSYEISNEKQRIRQLKSLAKSINGFRESVLGFVASTTTAR
ncbi:hypothetical protein T11_2380, partial [Trichinella zimbabwensis]